MTAMATQIHTRQKRKQQKMPGFVEPMLATHGELPAAQSDYTFEYKWDGVRAIGVFRTDNYRILARSGNDITTRYPELKHLADAVGNRNVILDGEIVALDESSRPSFGQLQHRMHLTNAKSILRLSTTQPVFYVLFDLLYVDGRSIMHQPYSTRRTKLEDLTLMGDVWQVTPAHVGEGRSNVSQRPAEPVGGDRCQAFEQHVSAGVNDPATGSK